MDERMNIRPNASPDDFLSGPGIKFEPEIGSAGNTLWLCLGARLRDMKTGAQTVLPLEQQTSNKMTGIFPVRPFVFID